VSLDAVRVKGSVHNDFLHIIIKFPPAARDSPSPQEGRGGCIGAHGNPKPRLCLHLIAPIDEFREADWVVLIGKGDQLLDRSLRGVRGGLLPLPAERGGPVHCQDLPHDFLDLARIIS
jgi:hypothetical protein